MKITKATLKSFIRKNEGKLYINVHSSYDGMVDCVTECRGDFTPIREAVTKFAGNNNLGIAGLWLVDGSRNWFTEYDSKEFIGIHIFNCCGSSTLAVKKTI